MTAAAPAVAAAAAAAPAAASSTLKYNSGFGNEFATEALPGALPAPHNTPVKCPYGLYAEQITGTSFTAPRDSNQRTWWYRIRPSIAGHGRWTAIDAGNAEYKDLTAVPTIATPEQLRWKPLPVPERPTTFVQGLKCYCGGGDPAAKAGIRIYLYGCNANMTNQAFSSSDGDLLLVPEHGTLSVTTEMGKLEVPSGYVAVIQRGIRFSVDVPSTGARGYVCEVFDGHFVLPPLGAIGANGLSNPRDFQTPVAWYEDRDEPCTCFVKYCDSLWSYPVDHSPFDVVAWHGNYAPYRYNLANFCAVNTVTYDHLDPSIFCVLTAQTAVAGTACCDFVIFPPRWMVAEGTFRPPYYHRNLMSEFMGNIRGAYEAKKEGFLPGGGSLHSNMQAHGPEAKVFEEGSNAPQPQQPVKAPDSNMAFMFESYYTLKLTPFAAAHLRDTNYLECWSGIQKHFNPNQK